VKERQGFFAGLLPWRNILFSSASYEDFASIDGLEKPIAFAEGDSV